MRILMINHEFTITGASTVFLRLALHLRGQGHEVMVYPCNPADGPMKTRFLEHGLAVVAQAVLADFDLAIANTICSAAQVIKIAGALRTIWFLHETEIGLNILLQNPQLAAAFQLAAAVVYQTAFQQEVYSSFTYQLDPGKFHIVANGIDIFIEQVARIPIPEKTQRLRVVQVGSVEPRKRPGDLVRAVARSGLAIEAVFCGKVYGLDENAAAIVAQAPERFRFLGETTQEATLAWLASADVFCLASISESQPISVFEAGLLGRPLLLSDLPGYRGVFSHGRNCLMFPPGYIELLALSLHIYAASPQLRADMGEAGRRTAQRYSNAMFLAGFDTVIAAAVAA